MATGFLHLGPAAEHTVEFVNEKGDRLVALILGYRRIHVGAIDGYMALGGEAVGDVLFGIAFKFHPKANDALFMAEQPGGFFLHKLLQRRSEFEVNT